MSSRWRDKDRPTKSAFIRAQKAATRYGTQLRKIARHVGDIVNAFPADDPQAIGKIDDALRRYAGIIEGWARATGRQMVEEVAARDKAAWMEVSRRMGKGLRQEIESTPTGRIIRERLDEQVKLIQSIPQEAAERVRKLANEGILQGRRAGYIAEEIMKSGEVAKSRANLIARTEVSRTASELTRARAEHVGSTMFIWRTAEDSDVRHDHQILNGKAFRWDSPPIADIRTGIRALPGCIWGCRCYPDPIIPDD